MPGMTRFRREIRRFGHETGRPAGLPTGGWLLLVAALAYMTALAALEIDSRQMADLVARHGEAAAERIRGLEGLMATARGLPERDKLEAVNDFFNRVPFAEDLAHWGKDDYWATPLELLASHGGDCEDYATAKYFTLIEVGVPEDRLRLTYAKAAGYDQSHMVLTYYEEPRAVPLVLDNLEPRILPASERDNLTPVYSFNGSRLWLAKARGSGKRVGNADRLAAWQALRQRMF